MICEKCGKELSDDASLCTSCGWKSRKWTNGVKDGKTNHRILAICIPLGISLLFFMIILMAVAIAQG